MTEAATVQPEVLVRCKHCKTLLAVASGDDLIVGAVIFPHSVTLVCQCCKKVTRWYQPKPSDVPR